MVEKRQALKLNANNIQLHEEAIKSFQKKQEEDEACKAIHVEHLNDFRKNCRQSEKERTWVNEKRRLDSLEATTLKQIRKQGESLSKLLSNTDCISVGGDDDSSCTGMKCDIVHVLTSFHDLSQQQAAPSIVANRLIQAREELVSIGEGLKEMRETASRELSRALHDVTESLRASYVDEKGQLFPDEVKAKIETLKKRILVAGAIEDDAATAAVMSLEADLHERFAAVHARYEQRIVVGGNANSNNLSEATMVLNRQLQQATKWALKRVDKTIDCESSRQQQAALAVVQKALTEESHSRLKLLREARENVAKNERQRVLNEKLDEEARQLELNALQVNERQQTKVGIEQWKEMQRKDEESKQSQAAQEYYQEELDRLNRMEFNGKRYVQVQYRCVDLHVYVSYDVVPVVYDDSLVYRIIHNAYYSISYTTTFKYK